MDRQKKKVDKGGVSERHLIEEKLQFQQAKQKELRSFFENQVWEFDAAGNAVPDQTMTARMLLKWSKNDDGSPRAKARQFVATTMLMPFKDLWRQLAPLLPDFHGAFCFP